MLIYICGAPGTGKTTLAKSFEPYDCYIWHTDYYIDAQDRLEDEVQSYYTDRLRIVEGCGTDLLIKHGVVPDLLICAGFKPRRIRCESLAARCKKYYTLADCCKVVVKRPTR